MRRARQDVICVTGTSLTVNCGRGCRCARAIVLRGAARGETAERRLPGGSRPRMRELVRTPPGTSDKIVELLGSR
jgi:hypothetical protein